MCAAGSGYVPAEEVLGNRATPHCPVPRLLHNKPVRIKVPPTLCKLLGYTEGGLLGRCFQELTHRDDVEANELQRLRLLRAEIKSFDIEENSCRALLGLAKEYFFAASIEVSRATSIFWVRGIPLELIGSTLKARFRLPGLRDLEARISENRILDPPTSNIEIRSRPRR
jgi:hypothetical protein